MANGCTICFHATLTAWALGLSLSTVSASPEERPNIIVVLTDDQGYGDVSAHGNPILKTPNLDRLETESLSFTNFFVSPTCAPTRSALLTGRHEFFNGVTHTILERERLAPGATTLSETLQGAGYATGIFGKWHLGDETEYRPDRRGFGETFIHGAGGIGQTYPGSCGDAPGNRYFDPFILHNGKFVKTDGYCTDIFFEQAIRWMNGMRQQQPFFCWISTNAPHAPYDARPEDAEKYAGLGIDPKLQNFYGMIHNIDDNVGRLLKQIETWGIADNTLVVFMNDNGSAIGATQFNAGMRGAKGSPWLGGTRANAFWHWPNRIAPGKCDALTSHVDLFPTLAGLAKVALSEKAVSQIQGRDLTSLLDNPRAPWSDRLLVTHVGRWPKGSDPMEYKYAQAAIRDTQFTLVSISKDAAPHWELYDVLKYPSQSDNVAVDHPEVVERLSKEYDRWWSSVQPFLVNEDAIPIQENPFKTLFREQFGATDPINSSP